jgi:hypothetical protein
LLQALYREADLVVPCNATFNTSWELHLGTDPNRLMPLLNALEIEHYPLLQVRGAGGGMEVGCTNKRVPDCSRPVRHVAGMSSDKRTRAGPMRPPSKSLSLLTCILHAGPNPQPLPQDSEAPRPTAAMLSHVYALKDIMSAIQVGGGTCFRCRLVCACCLRDRVLATMYATLFVRELPAFGPPTPGTSR